MFWFRVASVCLLLVALAPGLARSEGAQRNTKPFTRFKILLNGILNDTLPFDVRFYIWGDLPAATTKLTLRVADAGDLSDCSQVPAATYAVLAELADDALHSWTDTEYTDRGLTVPDKTARSLTKQFELLIPPLSPSRMYCFLFQTEPGRPLNDREQRLLIQRLEPAYRQFLESSVVRAASQAEIERLRHMLIATLVTAAPFEGFRPQAGSVFDPATDTPAIRAQFRDGMVAPVFTAHNNVKSLLDQIQGLGENAADRAMDVTEFARWINSPALDAVLKDPKAGETIKGDIRFLRSLGSRGQWNVLLGLPPESQQESLDEIWERDPRVDPQTCPTVGPLSTRCRALDVTLTQLARVRAAAPGAGTLIDETVEDMRETRSEILDLQSNVNQRQDLIEQHLQPIRGLIPVSIFAIATTIGNLETRRTWYIGLDTGLAIAPRISEVFPYAGANLYFRPVNTEAPPGPFLSRFAALVGFTWTSNLLKTGERQQLYGTNAMVVFGAGLRLTDILRVSGGALLFKGVDPNPLITRTRLEVTPFVAISADIDLAKLFGRDTTPPVLGAGTPPK
jgi:hypothetical protein